MKKYPGYVWVDAVSSKNIEIKNGGFEDIDEAGIPVGWFARDGKLAEVGKSKKVAKDGQIAVMVWTGGPVSQFIEVEAWKKYNPDDGFCGFSTNPYKTDLTEKREKQATQYYEEISAAYALAVMTFLEGKDDERAEDSQIGV